MRFLIGQTRTNAESYPTFAFLFSRFHSLMRVCFTVICHQVLCWRVFTLYTS